MPTVDDYVSRTEGTCGKEKDVIVTFKYEKRDEAVKKIRERAALKKSLAGIIFELEFKHHSFRLYSSGKVIFRGLESKDELNALLSALLL
jgi:TATA-box binding protein (TBP) (component of TFIID and TFIIIB)